MERPCDRECQVLGARADLFDASRRDAPRPCATECAPLARDPTNCRADVSHGRALMRRPDAQTMVTASGTHFGTPNVERPMSYRAWQCHLLQTKLDSSFASKLPLWAYKTEWHKLKQQLQLCLLNNLKNASDVTSTVLFECEHTRHLRTSWWKLRPSV